MLHYSLTIVNIRLRKTFPLAVEEENQTASGLQSQFPDCHSSDVSIIQFFAGNDTKTDIFPGKSLKD